MARGRFITLEGGEGSGKSTHAARLTESLGQVGIDALLTREPGGAPGAEEIRALLVEGSVDRWDAVSEVLLHFAARREHLEKTVHPALDAGRWVVSDRFADSTMAYQGFGHGVESDVITGLYDLVIGDFAPDLTLILDLPVEEGLRRTAARSDGENRYERMDVAFHQRLRDGYLDIARREPGRCAVIDAGGSVEDIQAAIRAVVGERLGIDLR